MFDPDRRRAVAGIAAATTAMTLGFPAVVRAEPKRLTIVLTVPPGTSSDTLARLLGEEIGAKLGRTVIVDSKPGAGGLIAVQYLRQQEADGSWLMMAPNSAVALLPLFSSRPTFDAEKDLMAVVEAAAAPLTFTVNASTGLTTLPAYFESVRKDASRGLIGIPSPVAMGALVIHQLGKQLNLPLQAVPFKGGAPLLNDLLGNQVPASASILPDYLEYHRAGRLRVLAVVSDRRSALAPEIPTLAEVGYPGYDAKTSFGLFGRSGLPADVAAQYAAVVSAALRVPRIVEALAKMGLEPVGGTPAEFQRKVLADRDRWAPVIKETGIRMDS